MQRLLLVGLNHTTAPLEIREKLVFSGQQRNLALQAFRQEFHEAEAVLLSTCNRVELYVGRALHSHPRDDEMIEFLAAYHGLPAAEVLPHFYRKTGTDVVTHLFSVAASLDSMVLGETQIIGQVRDAYEIAQRESAVAGILNPLFQRAIGVGKQVISQTSLAEGHVSVASVAVDYAKRIFDHFADKAVLSIGAGKMATLVLQSFQILKPGKLLVCNRDSFKAAELAARFAGTPVAYDDLAKHLVSADVVITSTGAPRAIITREMFEPIHRQRRYRPVFLIDIALPRNIDPAVGDMENVYLYNIDDLQQVVSSAHSLRASAVTAAREIIGKQVEEFLSSQRSRQLGPLIETLYQRYHDMAMEEVSRTVRKLGQGGNGERERLEELARRIVNKLLHDPVKMIRNAEGLDSPADQSMHLIEKLFGLAEPEHPRDPDAHK
ncbi:MAG: glutamyl-tRNA reductase [Tepidisphaeraceae bacterium]|jgi:glutamyl-tRNA reductase